MQRVFLVVMSILLFLPNLFHKDINPTPAYDNKEKFNPALAYLNTIGRLEAYTDSLAVKKNIAAGSYEYAELLELVVEERFYHGFSHFSFDENWIAAIGGKFVEEGLACKVKPEDILQNSNAACSQQSIVIMAILRNKNIDYRKIGFPHHYALEVLDKDNWYFIDADMEPAITKTERMESSWKHHNDLLKKHYDTSRFNDLDYKFGSNVTAINGSINEVPARNAKIFHSVTAVFSKILWFVPLLLLIFRSKFSFRKPHGLFVRRTTPAPASLMA